VVLTTRANRSIARNVIAAVDHAGTPALAESILEIAAGREGFTIDDPVGRDEHGWRLLTSSCLIADDLHVGR
jgi:hypothetical protein